METLTNNRLNIHTEESSRLIQQNFQEFRNLVAQAKNYVESGEYTMATVYAEMAAVYAMGKHCGLFVSPELERILVEIGQKTIKSNSLTRSRGLLEIY